MSTENEMANTQRLPVLHDVDYRCVIACGNPFDGLTMIGPFSSQMAAVDYAQECLLDQWAIITLEQP